MYRSIDRKQNCFTQFSIYIYTMISINLRVKEKNAMFKHQVIQLASILLN